MKIEVYYSPIDEKVDRRSKLVDAERRLAVRLLKTVDICEAAIQAAYASGLALYDGFDENEQILALIRRWVEKGMVTNEMFVTKTLRQELLDTAGDIRWEVFEWKDDQLYSKIERNGIYDISVATIELAHLVENIFKIEDYQSRIRHRLVQQMNICCSGLQTVARSCAEAFDKFYGNSSQTPGTSIVMNMLDAK